MNNFMAVVDEELKRQKELVRQCEKTRTHEPEGYLKVRKRKKGAAFYACEKTDNIVKERLIEKELDTVDHLFRKRVNSEVLKRAKTNVKALKLLKSSYQPNSYPEIAEKL